MTFIMVLLLGTGTLFISSSLDCTPIVSTFQKIVSGQKIDWSGSQCPSSPITFDFGSLINNVPIIGGLANAPLIPKPVAGPDVTNPVIPGSPGTSAASGNCLIGYYYNSQDGMCHKLLPSG